MAKHNLMWDKVFKVLPLVYDDSLSYYEVLSRLTRKINNVIEEIGDIPEYVDNALNEYTEEVLPQYIPEILDEYIQNLTSAADNIHSIVGETATDIQGEINDNAGKLLIFKGGHTYELDAMLTVPDDTVVNLNGATLKRVSNVHSVIRMGNHSVIYDGKIDGNCWTDGLSNNNNADRFSGIHCEGVDYVTIRNIEITGVCCGEYQPAGTYAGICLLDGHDFVIDGCYAYRNAGSVVYYGEGTYYPTYNVTITNCRFYLNGGSGITGFTNRLMVSNCLADTCGYAFTGQYASQYTGISLNGTNVVCTNCESYNNTGSGFILGHDTTTTDAALSNCIAKNNQLDGVSVGGAWALIENCILDTNGRWSGSAFVRSNIFLYTSNVNSIIRGCKIVSAEVLIRGGECIMSECYISHCGKANSVNYGRANIVNCTFVDVATSAEAPYGQFVVNTQGVAKFVNCISKISTTDYQKTFVFNQGTVYVLDTLLDGTNMVTCAGSGTNKVRDLPA